MKKNKKITLNMLFAIVLILGCLSVLVGFQNVSAMQNQAFGFTTVGSVDDWQVNYYGVGNHATLASNAEGSDPFATLTCDSFGDPSGWVAMTHNLQPLQSGAEYTLSFWYRSTAKIAFQYMSADASWTGVQQEYLLCPATTEWTHKVFTFVTFTDADVAHYWLGVNLYSVGSVDVDEIDLSITPDPTPVNTPAPNEVKVTLIGVGGGILMSHGGVLDSCSGLASSVYYVPVGTQVTLSANTAEVGKVFDHWELNGETSTENPIVLYQINVDTTIMAVYEEPSPPITPAPTDTPIIPQFNNMAYFVVGLGMIGVGSVGIGSVNVERLKKAVK